MKVHPTAPKYVSSYAADYESTHFGENRQNLEDFAESVQLFVTDKDNFIKAYPNRAAYLARILGAIPDSIEKQRLSLEENEIKNHADKVRENAPANWFAHKASSPSDNWKTYVVPLGNKNITVKLDHAHNATDPSDPLYWLNKAWELGNNSNILRNGTLLNDTLKNVGKAIDLDTRGEIFESGDSPYYFTVYVTSICFNEIEHGNASEKAIFTEILKWMLYDAKIYEKLIGNGYSYNGDVWRTKAQTLEYFGDYKAASECYMNASEAYDREGVRDNSTYYGADSGPLGPFGNAVEMIKDAQRTLAKAQELEAPKKQEVTTIGDTVEGEALNRTIQASLDPLKNPTAWMDSLLNNSSNHATKPG